MGTHGFHGYTSTRPRVDEEGRNVNIDRPCFNLTLKHNTQVESAVHEKRIKGLLCKRVGGVPKGFEVLQGLL
jgi:hypothetical protein